MLSSGDRGDKISSVNASFVCHLVDLRHCLIISLFSFLLAFMICFLVKEYILSFLLIPYKWAMKLSGGNPDNMRLQSTQVLETFLTKLKVAAFGGIVLAFPIIIFQMYRFIVPGLYKNERIAFLPFLVAAPILFFISSAFVYCIVAPLILWFSLSQQLIVNAHTQIDFIAKISEYLGFIISLIFAFGLVFQLPVVTLMLVRAKLLSHAILIMMRKWAIIVACIIAAMVTPSDIFSMFALALPTVMLYEASIFIAHLIEKKQNKQAEVSSNQLL